MNFILQGIEVNGFEVDTGGSRNTNGSWSFSNDLLPIYKTYGRDLARPVTFYCHNTCCATVMSYFHSHHLERFGLKLSRSLSERGAALTFLRGAGGKEDLARSDHSEKQAMFDPFGHLGGGKLLLQVIS